MARRIKKQPAAPQDFTPALALVDALPVLFFGASMVLTARAARKHWCSSTAA